MHSLCAFIVRFIVRLFVFVLCALRETIVRSLCAVIARSGCAQWKAAFSAQWGCTMQKYCALCVAQWPSLHQRSKVCVAQWFRHCAFFFDWYFVQYNTVEFPRILYIPLIELALRGPSLILEYWSLLRRFRLRRRCFPLLPVGLLLVPVASISAPSSWLPVAFLLKLPFKASF